MKKVNLLFRLLLVSFIVAADYVAKALVRASMYPGESIPLIGDILRVTYVQNYSGFSWFVPPLPAWANYAFQFFLIFLALAAFPIYLFYISARRHSIWTDVAFICLVASFLGHSVNDILLTFTVDFLQVFHSPKANFADLYAYIGIVALLIETVQVYSIQKPRWKGARQFIINRANTRKEFLDFIKRGFRHSK